MSIVWIQTLFLLSLHAQWTPVASPVKASLRGLCAVDAKTVWASGSGASVMRTIDGGANWQSFPIEGADGLDFRDVHAFDAQTAILMSAGPGEKSRIYRTEDGGAHWTLTHQNTQPKGFFDSIAFWDRKRGILVGDPVDGRFTILLTNDGGKSWKPMNPAGMPLANDGEGAFAASGTSIAVGKNGQVWFGTGGEKGGRVFRSTNWGKTWEAVETPIRHDAPQAGIFSLFFYPDGKRGIAAGGHYQKTREEFATRIVTSDGGRTWTRQDNPYGYRSAVVALGDVVVAAGPDGSDEQHGGGSGGSLPQGFHALSAAGGVVWASGSEGRIARLDVRVKN